MRKSTILDDANLSLSLSLALAFSLYKCAVFVKVAIYCIPLECEAKGQMGRFVFFYNVQMRIWLTGDEVEWRRESSAHMHFLSCEGK